MKKKHTLIMHVGLPKTGTTSIQLFLQNNKKQLEAQDVSYMDTGVKLNRAWLRPAELGCHTTQQAFQAVWGEVRAELDRNPAVIVSDERLCEVFAADLRAAQRVREFFNACEIKVILYLRRQDLHAESFYKHRLKRGELFLGSSSLDDIPELSLLHDYDKLASTLSQAFGRENIAIRVYEKAGFVQDDIYHDFIHAAGLSWDDGFEIPVRKQNISMDYNLMPLYDELYSHGLNKDEVFIFNRMVDTIAQERKTKQGGPLSDEQKKEYLSRFEDANKRVAIEYFGRDELFVEDDSTIQQGLSETELVKLFAEYAVNIHHHWYGFFSETRFLFPLRNWMAIKSLRQGTAGLSLARRCELLFRKAIHSIGWRLVPGWKTGWELEKQIWNTGSSTPSRFFKR